MFFSRMARSYLLSLAGASFGVALVGCGTQIRSASTETRTVPTSQTTPARAGPEVPVAPAPQPQKPDLARLTFDGSTRTLTVYDLPEPSARWMLITRSTPAGVPVDRQYRFPMGEELDLDEVAVFYTVPNRRPSPTVSLREILEFQSARDAR